MPITSRAPLSTSQGVEACHVSPTHAPSQQSALVTSQAPVLTSQTGGASHVVHTYLQQCPGQSTSAAAVCVGETETQTLPPEISSPTTDSVCAFSAQSGVTHAHNGVVHNTGCPSRSYGSCQPLFTTPRPSVPSFPPPLVPCSPVVSSEGSPFVLAFVTDNIRVCRGCRQRFLKAAATPMDLCVRHQEWQEFFSRWFSSLASAIWQCVLPL